MFESNCGICEVLDSRSDLSWNIDGNETNIKRLVYCNMDGN